MNDLDTVSAFRPDVALPSSSDLVAARRRLDEAIKGEVGAVSKTPDPDAVAPVHFLPDCRLKRVTRIALAGAIAAGAAAAAALFVLPGSPSPRARSGSAYAIQLTASRFLDAAATASLQQPAAPPLPGQFVYSETEDPTGSLSQTWLSADGSQPGINKWTGAQPGPIGTSGSNTLTGCSTAQAKSNGCSPNAGFFPDMPTDPSLVLNYLNSVHFVDTIGNPDDTLPGWEDNVLAKAVSELMGSSYLLPAQRAALFHLMAQTPGFHMVANAQDAIGRTGVGIEWTFSGGSGEVIFDASSYVYLGTRTWPAGGPTSATVAYDGDALVKLAVVSSSGILP